MKKDKKYSPQLFKAVSVDREKFQIRFVMSTPEVDRHGEVIDQSGWDFSKYLLNPVVLWAHDDSIPAVGKVTLIEKVGTNTEGVVQFAVKENPDAQVLFDLYAEGYMSAVSVGFMNTKWMFDEENDILTLLENELFELSLVNVPANASALAKAKRKGIDVSVLDRLDKAERFEGLGKKVEKKDIDTDDDEDEPDDEDLDEIEKDEEDEDEEETEEEKAARLAAEKEAAEKKEPTEDEVKAALQVLFKSSRDIIKASVKELQSRLNDAREDKQESSVGASPESQGLKKGLSNRKINSLVRSLLNSKS